MSKYDQQRLIASIHPFDLLDSSTISRLSAQMDIAYYPKETTLISPSIGSDFLYIIIKGVVNEFIENELHYVYGEMDSFDANTLIYNDTKSKFVVQEDLICYILKKEIFLNLIQDYAPFQNYFMQDFIAKHQLLKQHQRQNELTPFMMAKVSDIFLHTPCIVHEKQSIKSALIKMKELHAGAIVIKNINRMGIITDSDLRDRVLIDGVSLNESVKHIATYPFITIDKDDFLFNALLLFTKHNIKRLGVMHKGEIIGILEQIDLLSHFANHSYLIAMQVSKAQSIEEIANIQKEQLFMIQSMNAKGVKVKYITKLVSELNAKIYAKVYEFCVPKQYRQKAALLVMGSEGRQEQILRTDQDNALIIEDGVDPEIFTPFMNQFSEHLLELGFPPCKGKVMVNNPQWRGNVSLYKQRIDNWIESFDEKTLQMLSIFLDTHCVSGNEKLIEDVKEYLHKRFTGREDILAHMAKTTLYFETPLSIFSGFIVEKSEHKNEFDLKKGGIFAIVHGVRTLCLQNHISETNTTERIKALNNANIFDKQFATELIEAYDTLLSIRLKMRLNRPDYLEGANYINPARLDKIERDLLKDSFKVVNTFKKFLTYHFHLNVVM